VVFRSARRSFRADKKVELVIQEIERQMNEEFPNLKGPISEDLAALSGISHDIRRDMQKYTGKEIIGMGRIEKLSADFAD